MSRKFDEREVAQIFKMATEIEPERPSGAISEGDWGGGLDLEGLKEIALEVGVDPARVDQAARGLMIRPPAVAVSCLPWHRDARRDGVGVRRAP